MLHFQLSEEVKEQLFLILKDTQMFTLSHLCTYILLRAFEYWHSVLTFCDKEVEHGQDDSVTTEHIISTCMYSSQGHSKATPYCKCPLEFCPNIAIQLKNSDINLY